MQRGARAAAQSAPPVLSVNQSSYKTADILLALIRSKAVIRINGRYLIERAQHNLPIPSRQELEREQNPQVADWFISKEGMQEPDLFLHQPSLVVSCPWLTPEHPDPECWQLQRVVEAVRRRSLFGHMSTADAEKNVGRDVWVFWDYMSLYQAPRTPQQEALYQQALSCMDVWYGHEFTRVVLLTDGVSAEGEPITYSDRGWCTFEQQVALMASKQYGVCTVSSDQEYRVAPRILQASEGSVMPPDVFRQLMTTKAFSVDADRDRLCDMYHRFYFANLTLSHGCLADSNAHILASALVKAGPLPRDLLTLNMSRNPALTDIGAAQVFKACATQSRHGVSAVVRRIIANSGDIHNLADETAPRLGELSCLLALAFIPRFPDPIAGRDVLELTQQFWMFDLLCILDTHPQREECVAALCYVFNLPNNCRRDRLGWERGLHGDTRSILTMQARGHPSVNEGREPGGAWQPRVLLAPEAGKTYTVREDGYVYVGGTDRHGRALGFGKLWTNGEPATQIKQGFFLDGELLEPPITGGAVNVLERAILQDMVERGRITQEQMDLVAEKVEQTGRHTKGARPPPK